MMFALFFRRLYPVVLIVMVLSYGSPPLPSYHIKLFEKLRRALTDIGMANMKKDDLNPNRNRLGTQAV